MAKKEDKNQKTKLTVGGVFKAYLLANSLREKDVEKQTFRGKGSGDYGKLLVATSTLSSVLNNSKQEIEISPDERQIITSFAAEHAQELMRMAP